MKLSKEQLRVLALLAVADRVLDFRVVWLQSIRKTKKGQPDGNALQGRGRTVQSLRDAGLVAGWKLTAAGLDALRAYASGDSWRRGVPWMSSVPTDGIWPLCMLNPGLVTHDVMRSVLERGSDGNEEEQGQNAG